MAVPSADMTTRLAPLPAPEGLTPLSPERPSVRGVEASRLGKSQTIFANADADCRSMAVPSANTLST